jgi:hypothetical protein
MAVNLAIEGEAERELAEESTSGEASADVKGEEDSDRLAEVRELADVREAMLDDEQLRALLSDIATYGEVRELTVKSAPRSRPDPVSRLPELYLKLVQRRVFGAQIRYLLEGQVWLDTLIATPEGLRLVRVELPQ